MKTSPIALAFLIPGTLAMAQNTLTPVEQAQGWKLLSGPDATQQWRGYKSPSFPEKGWTFADGAFTHQAQGGGGDIITNDQFGDFEFECEFKTAPKANSGIIYRIAETKDTPWMTGPEFQVIDDAGAEEKPDSVHSSGALYDIVAPPAQKALKPAGEWNAARVSIRSGVLQHWLNGMKVVEARLFDESGKPTPEWLAKIEASKFKQWPGFGLEVKGHIGLQDHGDEVSYRNLRARDLSAPLKGEVLLFNGKDLGGLEVFTPAPSDPGARIANPFSVQNGILVVSGTPNGYIRTTKDYTNYILKLEWRFNPVTKAAGNSGVLLRMVGEDKVWPKSVEAQLHSGNAGDFWNIDEFRMKADPARTKGRNTKKTHGAERPIGEWNQYEIIVNRGDVILSVNGEEVNRATDVESLAGKICFQSEGAEIHFRNIRLIPLP